MATSKAAYGRKCVNDMAIIWYTMSVDYIREWLADICLVGAAAFSVAWVMLINRGRMARAADRIAKTSRSAVAAFLFFAAIATVCAQKSGTNEPPRSGNAELRMENVELRMGNGVAAGDSSVRDEKWWRRGKRECKMENVEWRMCA